MKEFFKKLSEFFSKLLKNISDKPIPLLIAILVIVISIVIINIITLNKPNNLDVIRKEVEEAKKEAEKYKTQSERYIQDIKNLSVESKQFRQQSEMYRKELESVKNGSNFASVLEFSERFSLFNETFAKKNEETYLTLSNYYSSLLAYDNKLQTYKKALDKNALRWSITPYAMVWKDTTFHFGGGIDLMIPITTDFSLVGGFGYYQTPFLKIGINLKF